MNPFSLHLVVAPFFLVSLASALIPATPGEQTRRAIASTKATISKIRANNLPPRLYIDYLLPLPPETNAADIDPWPGGLAQMYPYAEQTIREILLGVVDESTSEQCSSQIISSSDCCGFFVQESPISPELDVAALLFPGPDQLSNIQQIETMVGPKRTLLIFNRQFNRPADFGFFQKSEAQKAIFDKYQWGFAFQEIACRGEDVKLTFEESKGGWHACVLDENGKEFELDLEGDRMVRPEYGYLEKKVNQVLPEPLWMRKIGEVQEKGLKFQREE